MLLNRFLLVAMASFIVVLALSACASSQRAKDDVFWGKASKRMYPPPQTP